MFQGVQKFWKQQAVLKKQAATHNTAESNSMWQLLWRGMGGGGGGGGEVMGICIVSHQEILIIN